MIRRSKHIVVGDVQIAGRVNQNAACVIRFGVVSSTGRRYAPSPIDRAAQLEEPIALVSRVGFHGAEVCTEGESPGHVRVGRSAGMSSEQRVSG